jgi:AmmeMemoRadiSam system protein A
MIERDRRGKVLLSIARDGIADRLGTARCGRWPEPWLEERAATFVTLRLAGDLRGCIGSLEAVRALGEDVYDNARAAAYRDPRFPPVGDRERDGLEVEISILSQAEPIAAATESDALAALRPGLDGVVLQFRDRRATFLPQVWEMMPDALTFLSELRVKAHLPARFWDPGLRLARYTVEKYR